MNKQEVLLFMMSSFMSDIEENMKLMGASEEQIKEYMDTNKRSIEYLVYNLHDRMCLSDLINHD